MIRIGRTVRKLCKKLVLPCRYTSRTHKVSGLDFPPKGRVVRDGGTISKLTGTSYYERLCND